MIAIVNIWNKIYDGHFLLAITGAFFGVLFFLSTALITVDHSMLMGVNVWLKPSKFALSGIIFNWTIALLLPLYLFPVKTRKMIGNVIAIAMSTEIVIIFIQAARVELSHYNTSTPLNGILFGMMGIGIVIITLSILYLAYISFKQKMNTAKAIAWSIRFAWLAVAISLIGGQMMISNQAHNIGVPDGGPGLPILNWSTLGGDLRVMHFMGLHALQILPLLIFGFRKLNLTKNENHELYFTVTSSTIYLSLILLTWWQALKGMPFLYFTP